MLVSSALVGGVFTTQFVNFKPKVGSCDLSVSTREYLENSIVDKHVLILYNMMRQAQCAMFSVLCRPTCTCIYRNYVNNIPLSEPFSFSGCEL